MPLYTYGGAAGSSSEERGNSRDASNEDEEDGFDYEDKTGITEEEEEYEIEEDNEINGSECYAKATRVSPMMVYVETLTGTAFEVRVSSYEAVISIKDKIQRLEGIPISQQHLLYGNAEMKDDCTLRDYDIQNGATLRLVLGMRGGPINTRRVPMEEPVLRDIDLMEAKEQLSRRLGNGSNGQHFTLLVLRNGQQVNLYRVVDRTEGSLSPLSESSSTASGERRDAFLLKNATPDKRKHRRRRVNRNKSSGEESEDEDDPEDDDWYDEAEDEDEVIARDQDDDSGVRAVGTSHHNPRDEEDEPTRMAVKLANLKMKMHQKRKNKLTKLPQKQLQHKECHQTQLQMSSNSSATNTNATKDTNDNQDYSSFENTNSTLNIPKDKLNASPLLSDKTTPTNLSTSATVLPKINRENQSSARNITNSILTCLNEKSSTSNNGTQNEFPHLKKLPPSTRLSNLFKNPDINHNPSAAMENKISSNSSTGAMPPTSYAISQIIDPAAEMSSNNLKNDATSSHFIGQASLAKSLYTNEDFKEIDSEDLAAQNSSKVKNDQDTQENSTESGVKNDSSSSPWLNPPNKDFDPFKIAQDILQVQKDTGTTTHKFVTPPTLLREKTRVRNIRPLEMNNKTLKHGSGAEETSLVEPKKNMGSLYIDTLCTGERSNQRKDEARTEVVGKGEDGNDDDKGGYDKHQSSSTHYPHSSSQSKHHKQQKHSSHYKTAPTPTEAQSSNSRNDGVNWRQQQQQNSFYVENLTELAEIKFFSSILDKAAVKGKLTRISPPNNTHNHSITSANSKNKRNSVSSIPPPALRPGFSGSSMSKNNSTKTVPAYSPLNINSHGAVLAPSTVLAPISATSFPDQSSPRARLHSATKKKPRCFVCGKKTRIGATYSCRCEGVFCAQHRYAESHDCSFDYKSEGKKLLEHTNPVVTAPKLPKI